MDNSYFVNNEFFKNQSSNNLRRRSSIALEKLPKNKVSILENIKVHENSINQTNVTNNEPPKEKEWSTYTKKGKISYIIFAFIKIIMFIVLLYVFLLSLNFMTIGFTMVAGYAIKAGPVIKFILSNPFAALAIGIIATAIMQNAT